MAGRYTTYLDRDPSNVRAEMMENLNQKISGVGDIYLQQKLKEKERQKEWEDWEKRFRKQKEIEKEYRYNPFEALFGGGAQLETGAQMPNILGQMPGRQIMPKEFSVDAEGNIKPVFEFMPTEEEKQAEIEQAAKKTAAIEEAKPYTEGEIKIVSGQSLIPQIDKLIKLAEENKIYEGLKVPFGGSRISAFGEEGPWQSFKRGLTGGKGREAGLILQDIKQLMFATGGQALTAPEIQKLAPKLEPAYKTEKQWIADLKDVKQRIIDKARLLRPNPNEVFRGQSRVQIGQKITKGGKEYQVTGFDTDGEPLVDLVR